ncbi:hypothetical protein M5D96_006805 [Drosophila gunungcola]|uniref:Uncharacterized protein n=1 Tax=Drosophila gunungcola TaxID=103775 RepID=A0A9Q0BQD2_9MUSC|nr:hypothetical protein M5D96_006805 [Drosophila gunungcola]
MTSGGSGVEYDDEVQDEDDDEDEDHAKDRSPDDYGHVREVRNAVNKNSLDTLSPLEAPKERRSRATWNSRDPRQKHPGFRDRHAITDPSAIIISICRTVIPEPISDDDSRDDDAAANDRQRV